MNDRYDGEVEEDVEDIEEIEDHPPVKQVSEIIFIIHIGELKLQPTALVSQPHQAIRSKCNYPEQCRCVTSKQKD